MSKYHLLDRLWFLGLTCIPHPTNQPVSLPWRHPCSLPQPHHCRFGGTSSCSMDKILRTMLVPLVAYCLHIVHTVQHKAYSFLSTLRQHSAPSQSTSLSVHLFSTRHHSNFPKCHLSPTDKTSSIYRLLYHLGRLVLPNFYLLHRHVWLNCQLFLTKSPSHTF